MSARSRHPEEEAAAAAADMDRGERSSEPPPTGLDCLADVYRCFLAKSCPGQSAAAVARVIFSGVCALVPSEDANHVPAEQSQDFTCSCLTLVQKLSSTPTPRPPLSLFCTDVLGSLLQDLGVMSQLVSPSRPVHAQSAAGVHTFTSRVTGASLPERGADNRPSGCEEHVCVCSLSRPHLGEDQDALTSYYPEQHLQTHQSRCGFQGTLAPGWLQTCVQAFHGSAPGCELDACLWSLTDVLKKLLKGAHRGKNRQQTKGTFQQYSAEQEWFVKTVCTRRKLPLIL